jgi:hypothetical protein
VRSVPVKTELGSVYDAEPERETKRGQIAIGLLVLLAGTILASFVSLAARWIAIADLRTLLEIVLGPEVSLTGAAVGFYFGAKPHQR